MLSVVTPEIGPLAPAADGGNPPELAAHDPALHFERAQALADLFSLPARRTAAGLDLAGSPANRKTVPGLEEALKVNIDGVMGVFVCGSGPGVGILSRQNADRAIQAVRRCFLENGIASTYGTFRPTHLGAQELNGARPQITFPAFRRVETRASESVS